VRHGRPSPWTQVIEGGKRDRFLCRDWVGLGLSQQVLSAGREIVRISATLFFFFRNGARPAPADRGPAVQARYVGSAPVWASGQCRGGKLDCQLVRRELRVWNSGRDRLEVPGSSSCQAPGHPRAGTGGCWTSRHCRRHWIGARPFRKAVAGPIQRGPPASRQYTRASARALEQAGRIGPAGAKSVLNRAERCRRWQDLVEGWLAHASGGAGSRNTVLAGRRRAGTGCQSTSIPGVL